MTPHSYHNPSPIPGGGLKRRHNTGQTAFPAYCNLLARSAQRPSPRTPNQRTRPSTPGQSPPERPPEWLRAPANPRPQQLRPLLAGARLRAGIPMLWLSAGSCESVIGETGYRRSVGGGRMGALSGRFRLLEGCVGGTRIVTRGVLIFFGLVRLQLQSGCGVFCGNFFCQAWCDLGCNWALLGVKCVGDCKNHVLVIGYC